MRTEATHNGIAGRLIDGLYVEAMVLADEVRSYFDRGGLEDREAMCPADRVAFSCESLKVTTRLMHVVSWLLLRRAADAGELRPAELQQPARRLGDASDTDSEALAAMPERARLIIEASCDLYQRIKRLDDEMMRNAPVTSPARSLLDRLERSL